MDQIAQVLALASQQGLSRHPGGEYDAGSAEEFSRALAEAVLRESPGGGSERGIENAGWDWTAADGTRLRFSLSAKEETSALSGGEPQDFRAQLDLEEELIAALRSVFARAFAAGSFESSPFASEQRVNPEALNSLLNRLISASGEAKPLLIPVETSLGNGLLSVSYVGTTDANEHIFTVSLETRAGNIAGRLAISILPSNVATAPGEHLETAFDTRSGSIDTISKPAAPPFDIAGVQIRQTALNDPAFQSALRISLLPAEFVFAEEGRQQPKQTLLSNPTGSSTGIFGVKHPLTAMPLSLPTVTAQTPHNLQSALLPGTINSDGAALKDFVVATETQPARPAFSGSAVAFPGIIGNETMKTNRPLATSAIQTPTIDESSDIELLQATDLRNAATPNVKTASHIANVKLAEIPRIVLEQIGDMKALGQSGRLVVMETDPPHLGPVTSRIEIAGASVSVTFIVANAISRDAIEQQLFSLRAALEAQGFGDAQVNVEIGTGGGDTHEFADNKQSEFGKSKNDMNVISTSKDPDSTPFGGVRGAVYI